MMVCVEWAYRNDASSGVAPQDISFIETPVPAIIDCRGRFFIVHVQEAFMIRFSRYWRMRAV